MARKLAKGRYASKYSGKSKAFSLLVASLSLHSIAVLSSKTEGHKWVMVALLETFADLWICCS